MTSQAAIALQSQQYVEQIEKIRIKETAFLELVSEISSEFDLSAILVRVVKETTTMLNAERATIFLHDPATGTLFSRVSSGGEISEIRFPSHLGIAGAVFTSGESMNIPYAYADLRFNPAFDRQTGFFTRSILCVPIVNKDDKVIGVTQMLNKRGGIFTDEDEQRLKAFTAQIAIALENSKLFDDVRRMKDYTDAMLQSMSNGVITLDPQERGRHLQRLGRADLVLRAGQPGRQAARDAPRRGQQVADGRDRKGRVDPRQRNLPRCRR